MAKKGAMEVASKEAAKLAQTAFTRIIGRLQAGEALSVANDIRMVSRFISTAEAKLPSKAAYDRDRIRRKVS